MKLIRYLFLSIFLLFSAGLYAANDLTSFFNKADAFFKKRVHHGMLDYQNISNNFNTIDELYRQLGNMDLSGATDREKKAFYINAYNLIVIHTVVKYYPLNSPMDKSGFFDQLEHKVANEQMTLDYLENNKLIIPYQDARIHFAVACAALSCPPLAGFAYMPEKLDDQLMCRTEKAVNDPEFIKVYPDKKEVAVSKIFDWYNKDFTKGGQTIIEYLNKYRNEKIPSDYKVTFYEYNWQLNEQT